MRVTDTRTALLPGRRWGMGRGAPPKVARPATLGSWNDSVCCFPSGIVNTVRSKDMCVTDGLAVRLLVGAIQSLEQAGRRVEQLPKVHLLKAFQRGKKHSYFGFNCASRLREKVNFSAWHQPYVEVTCTRRSPHSRSLKVMSVAVILLFSWFDLKKNELVLRMRPPLRTGGDINILACLWF